MAHLTCRATPVTRSPRSSTTTAPPASRTSSPSAATSAGRPADARPSDYTYATDLLDDIDRATTSRSASPPTPRCTRARRTGTTDRRFLAAKLGRADFAITQFFFEAEHYVRLVDELAELGVDKPVMPGIMPITNTGQVGRMAAAQRRRAPGVAGRAARRRRRPRRGPPHRRRRGHRAVRRAAGGRRTRPALLHAEPQHGEPGDLRQPRARRRPPPARTSAMIESATRPLEWSPPRTAISRVPYLPGLDGMRALAVVAVMVYHANTLVARRVPRRRGVLRDQRLPDHAAADRRARAHRPGQPGPVLAAAGPPAAAGAVHAADRGHDLHRAVPARRARPAARRRRRRRSPTCRTGTRSGSARATRRPATSRRCATCGASPWRSSSTWCGRW